MLYRFYCIKNKQNGKIYIGVSKRDIRTRFSEHVKSALSEHDLRNDYVMPLLNAIRKYGKESFSISLLDEREFNSFSDAETYEGSLIKMNESFNSDKGYNINYRNSDGTRYYINAVCEKIVKNNTGNNNPFFGKTHSYEVRKILSEKAKERFSKPENNPRYGYKFTEEDKAKWRKSKEKFGKPFYAEGILYQTLSEAARKYNLTKQAIKNRIVSNNYKDWFYKGENNE